MAVITKLGKKEVERVRLACELVETKVEEFSCLAVEWGFGDEVPDQRPAQHRKLVSKYGELYDRNIGTTWAFEDKDTEAGRQERILAMLFMVVISGAKL